MARARNLTIEIGNHRLIEAGIPERATVETSRKRFHTTRRVHTLDDLVNILGCTENDRIYMSDLRDVGGGLMGVILALEAAVKHNPGLRAIYQNGGLPHFANLSEGKLKLKRSGQFSEVAARGIIRGEESWMVALFEGARCSA